MEMLSGFTEEEMEVLSLFLEEGISIREISNLKPEFGRTKISNILNRYSDISEENAAKVQIVRYNRKSHKQVKTLEEISEAPLNEEEIEDAYKKIVIDGVTLTEISSILGKNRETVKKAIIDFLDNKADIENFKKVLQENQKSISSGEGIAFLKLPEEERKKRIFKRLNTRRLAKGREIYSEELLERKYNRLVDYLYEKRNSKIDKEEDELSIEDIQCMMYEFPTMLSMSLTDKIKPIIGALDNKYFDYAITNRILKANPSILGTAFSRIKLQIKILKSTKTLGQALSKPRIFRTSPELMYALAKEAVEKDNTDRPFISKNRIPRKIWCYSRRTYKKT